MEKTKGKKNGTRRPDLFQITQPTKTPIETARGQNCAQGTVAALKTSIMSPWQHLRERIASLSKHDSRDPVSSRQCELSYELAHSDRCVKNPEAASTGGSRYGAFNLIFLARLMNGGRISGSRLGPRMARLLARAVRLALGAELKSVARPDLAFMGWEAIEWRARS